MNNGERDFPALAEAVMDIACLAVSYGILFLLPQKVGFFFYLAFFISALMFSIGFFRIGFLFDGPATSKGVMILRVVFTLLGIALIAAGALGVYLDQFSPRSIVIATLLVIEAICLIKMGGGSRRLRNLLPGMQAVPGMKLSIEDLREAFASVETQLGYPWIGEIRSIEQNALIYGPAEDGFCVYGNYQFGTFYVSSGTNLLSLSPEDRQGHTVKEVPDSSGKLIERDHLPAIYADMFARFAESGIAQWRTDQSTQT